MIYKMWCDTKMILCGKLGFRISQNVIYSIHLPEGSIHQTEDV